MEFLILNEPDVSLTDLALTVECWLLFYLLWSASSAKVRLTPWFLALFAASGSASLCGALYHGAFAEGTDLRNYAARGAQLFVGCNSFALWNLAVRTPGLPNKLHKPVLVISVLFFVTFAAYILSKPTSFLLAVATYLPAIIIWLLLLIYARVSHSCAGTGYGITAIVVTLLAATIQQMKIALIPHYFTYNAFFHLLQGIGLFLTYKFALKLSEPNSSAKVRSEAKSAA